jgi:dihydrofolate reductase
VFVLTHYPRPSITMQGGTVFHFVTGGAREAYGLAMHAAHGKDVRVGGGANTIRQYLAAGLVDHMHLAIGRILLGSGEHLFAGLDLPSLGYTVLEQTNGENATHVVIGRRSLFVD